jgi:hypothetical protein
MVDVKSAVLDQPGYGAVETAAAADLHPQRIQAVLPPDDGRVQAPDEFDPFGIIKREIQAHTHFQNPPPGQGKNQSALGCNVFLWALVRANILFSP